MLMTGNNFRFEKKNLKIITAGLKFQRKHKNAGLHCAKKNSPMKRKQKNQSFVISLFKFGCSLHKRFQKYS